MAPETTDYGSLSTLLLQKTPNIPTRKGLILADLPYDSLSREVQMPGLETGFIDRIKRLTHVFRPYGDLIWIRTEFEDTKHPGCHRDRGSDVGTNIAHHSLPMAKESTDEDDTLGLAWPQSPSSKYTEESVESSRPIATSSYKQKWPSPSQKNVPSPALEADEEPLTRTPVCKPCCIKGTPFSDYAVQAEVLVQPQDLQIVKSCHSAFSSTSLLHTLRSRLITELYICGCMTEASLHATVLDAARYGINIVLVHDCLGYRKRGDSAIQRLVDLVEADVVTGDGVISALEKSSWVPTRRGLGSGGNKSRASSRNPTIKTS